MYAIKRGSGILSKIEHVSKWKGLPTPFLWLGVLTVVSSVDFGVRPIAAASPTAAACADLVRLTFEGNTTIANATTVSGGQLTTPAKVTLTDLPEFCGVIGVSRPTSDSEINFEVWLPAAGWNGRFLSSGEGGFAGVLSYRAAGSTAASTSSSAAGMSPLHRRASPLRGVLGHQARTRSTTRDQAPGDRRAKG